MKSHSKHRRVKTIGILAFQGDVLEHKNIIAGLGHDAVEVRSVDDLEQCDGLIIPGGESTTIGFFLEQSGTGARLKKLAADGFPVFGTCAGAIVLAKQIIGNIIPPHLGLIDITVQRNAYGRQIDSFSTDVDIPELHIKALHAAFIRAPVIQKTGREVKILARHDKKIILVQQENILAATFHPELRKDSRLHQYFASLIEPRA